MVVNEKEIKSSEATGICIDADDTGKMSDMHIEQSKPPDGGWGWVVVFASFLILVITEGIVSSFGIFFLELLDFYQSGKGETAWVGSLVPGITFLVGPLAGCLAKQFDCRITTIVGAIIAAIGFVLSTFAPNLYFLYFSFGILAGVGFGLAYFPAVVSVGHYFHKKRTFAVGLACCGTGIGGFIFNPLTKILIDVYGWRGAILIHAGLVLNCAVCGAIFRPLNSNKACDKSSIRIVDNKQSFPEECADSMCKTDTLQTEDGNAVKDMKGDHRKKRSCFDGPANSIRQTCGISMFKDVTFVLYVISNVLASFGVHIPFMILYDYAVNHDVGEDSAKWLGSIIGITNTCGRVICGIIADRTKINKLVLFRTALIMCGLVTMLCPLCNNFTLLVLYSCVFGFLIGIYIPLISVVLVDLFGIEMLNNSFGILIMFKGFAVLLGPPVAEQQWISTTGSIYGCYPNGWLFDVTGSYVVSFLASGVTLALGGVILHLPPLILRCRKRSQRRANGAELDQISYL